MYRSNAHVMLNSFQLVGNRLTMAAYHQLFSDRAVKSFFNTLVGLGAHIVRSEMQNLQLKVGSRYVLPMAFELGRITFT